MHIPSPFHQISHPTHNLWIKRDDLIHPIICGNKWRKISGYLQTHFPDSIDKKSSHCHFDGSEAKWRNLTPHPQQDLSTPLEMTRWNKTKKSSLQLQAYGSILTFGGAYSNHLRAIAHTGRLYDIPTIGIVRGEELATKPLNNNLQFCHDQGMELHFVNRQTYRQIKISTTREEIHNHISLSCEERARKRLIIPEGGCGPEGLIGTHQIIREISEQHKMSTSVYFCIEAGTGTTAAGCIQAIQELGLNRKVIVIPVLHDLPTIEQNIQKYTSLSSQERARERCNIITGYEHSGYAKTSSELINFIDDRKDEHHIHIEPIYSGKLMYAVYDLIDQGHFPSDAEIIIYHSGY